MLRDYLNANNHEVWWTTRKKTTDPLALTLDVNTETEVAAILERVRPEVVINAVGILNDDATRRPEEPSE